jgi:hypothetical protein
MTNKYTAIVKHERERWVGWNSSEWKQLRLLAKTTETWM